MTRCAAATAIGAALAAMAMAWLSRLLLRPVSALAGRIGAAGVPTELKPVVARLADLLGRLDASFAGCTLPASAGAQVFDRFWRGDSARSAAGVHCGLGLALCRKLATAQGGTINATITDGRFAVEIRLPLG